MKYSCLGPAALFLRFVGLMAVTSRPCGEHLVAIFEPALVLLFLLRLFLRCDAAPQVHCQLSSGVEGAFAALVALEGHVELAGIVVTCEVFESRV